MTGPAGLEIADSIAYRLADPDTLPTGGRAMPSAQSLACGPPGIALLHIERAARGLGPWRRAHLWLAAATRHPVTAGPDSHPFHGTPALAHAVACAAEHCPRSYRQVLDTLDRQIGRDIARRLDAAHRRIDHGHPARLAEFDTLRGLSGYGAYLLRRDPTGAAMTGILDYTVRLTEPITHDGDMLPGWWAASGPSGADDDRFPGGHANSGVAHGVGGVLGMLALAARHGATTSGRPGELHGALRRILSWLDRWRHDIDGHPAWPYWVTRAELRAGRLLSPSGPRRPSWCYGAAGLARAQQLAALALGDTGRRIAAENALIAALTDPAQLATVTTGGLCHGAAGLAHVATRAAADAHPGTADRLRAAVPELLQLTASTDAAPAPRPDVPAGATAGEPGLLDGAAGIALALTTAHDRLQPLTGWDRCLVIA